VSVTRSIYVLWLRELKREWREKSRIIASLMTPILWLFIFGTGIRVGKIEGVTDYRVFIFPGIIGMTLLFASMRSGISVIWDKEFGFMKEILVAPVSRTTITFGKAIGGATNAFLQGIVVLILSPLIGLRLNPIRAIPALPMMFVIALGLECIGLLIGILLDSLEGFQLIMSFITMPMFFLSGALFPMNTAPKTLEVLSYIDPLTYGVDALRIILLGNNGILPLWIDLVTILAFASLMISLCSLTLRKRKQ